MHLEAVSSSIDLYKALLTFLGLEHYTITISDRALLHMTFFMMMMTFALASTSDKYQMVTSDNSSLFDSRLAGGHGNCILLLGSIFQVPGKILSLRIIQDTKVCLYFAVLRSKRRACILPFLFICKSLLSSINYLSEISAG